MASHEQARRRRDVIALSQLRELLRRRHNVEVFDSSRSWRLLGPAKRPNVARGMEGPHTVAEPQDAQREAMRLECLRTLKDAGFKQATDGSWRHESSVQCTDS
jgi:hypothetical protein